MPPSFIRLLTKYFIILTSPVVILALLGYVSVLIAREYATRQIDELAANSLLQLERASEQLLEEAEATAVALGTAGQVLRVLREQMDAAEIGLSGLRELDLVRNLVNTSAHARPRIQSIYIYLEGFDSVLTTHAEIQPIDGMLDTSWLSAYRAQSPEVLTWAARRIHTPLGPAGPRGDVISVYQRLFNFTAGDLSGVVVLNLPEMAVRRLLSDAAVHAEQHFAVFDSDDNLVVSDLDNDRYLPMLEEVMARESDAFSVEGTEYLLRSSQSTQTGWQYAMLIPQTVYFEPVRRMVRLNVTILTLAVLFGAGVAGVMARRSYRYIKEIVDVIERANAGLQLPEMQGHSTTGFSYITYHVLRAFVERQYYQLQLSERAYRQKALELLALQSQMNPHFLFNTLEAVNWQILSETGKPGAANEMIGSLASIMKYALRSPTTFVTLGEELDNVNHYVRIQSLRQRNTYELHARVPENLLRIQMVPMTLQPLVENAIVHGFGDGSQGSITIEAKRSENKLFLRITDDGIGVGEDRLKQLRAELVRRVEPGDDHIGLVNTVRRLRLAFDGEVSVSLSSRNPGGFHVALTIPLQFAPHETSG